MRALQYLIVVPALVLMAASCGPHRHMGHRGPGGEGWQHPPVATSCGGESCTYRSRCFSNGAVHSNGGVCQSCNGGRWVAATGCSDEPCDGHCHDCGGMKGKGKGKKGGEPCHHHGGGSHAHDH